MLLTLTATSMGLILLPDGRRCSVLKNDEAIAARIRSRVAELAQDAIATKGAFSISIGSGTTVAPLTSLPDETGIDFSRFHVFFGNDRTEGDAAGKCFNGAAAFISACGIPDENVHRVPPGPATESAATYETLLRGMPENVVGDCKRTGLPRLDLVLLGSGADGHTASLYPDSSQVVEAQGRAVVAAAGKGGVTLTLGCMCSAGNVLLSAGKKTQSDMVRKALGWSNAATNSKCPAGMISATPGDTEVEWLLTEDSAVELPLLID